MTREEKQNRWKTETPAVVVMNGGKQAEAIYRDGTKEDVFVRLPPAHTIEDFFSTLADIEAFVDFICAKEAGWSASLVDDSLVSLYHLGREINDPRFARFWEILMEAGKKAGEKGQQASALMSGLPRR